MIKDREPITSFSNKKILTGTPWSSLGPIAYMHASNCAPLVTKELGADVIQQPCFTAIYSRGFEIRGWCDNGRRFDPLISETPLVAYGKKRVLYPKCCVC